MKSGIIRRIDDLGRIVIPKELRKHLNADVGDSLEFVVDGDKLYLEKYIENQEYEMYVFFTSGIGAEHPYALHYCYNDSWIAGPHE